MKYCKVLHFDRLRWDKISSSIGFVSDNLFSGQSTICCKTRSKHNYRVNSIRSPLGLATACPNKLQCLFYRSYLQFCLILLVRPRRLLRQNKLEFLMARPKLQHVQESTHTLGHGKMLHLGRLHLNKIS